MLLPRQMFDSHHTYGQINLNHISGPHFDVTYIISEANAVNTIYSLSTWYIN